MENHLCLNCDEPIAKKFCPNCGQKTDTHRITLKHFIAHDLIHGVWHLDKGLLFTVKEAIIRPGKAALDYIGGKRLRYYNVFYLALLLIALNALLYHYYRELVPKKDASHGIALNRLLSAYSKVFILSIVPMLAVNARIVFRRWKLNLAEHFIVAGMALLGVLMCTGMFLFFNILTELTDWNLFAYVYTGFFFMIPFVPLWTYANAFHKKYSVGGTIWRVLVFYLIGIIETCVIFGAIVYYMTNGKFLVDLTI